MPPISSPAKPAPTPLDLPLVTLRSPPAIVPTSTSPSPSPPPPPPEAAATTPLLTSLFPSTSTSKHARSKNTSQSSSSSSTRRLLSRATRLRIRHRPSNSSSTRPAPASPTDPLARTSPGPRPAPAPTSPAPQHPPPSPRRARTPLDDDAAHAWRAQWDQIRTVLAQGWTYVLAKWHKTRIARGIVDYWTMHVIYLFTLGLAGAIVIFIGESARQLDSVAFVDCFFLAVSAITGTGLSVQPFHESTRTTTITCYLLMSVGSSIMLSIPPVLLRRYLYRQAHAVEFAQPGGDGHGDTPTPAPLAATSTRAPVHASRDLYSGASALAAGHRVYLAMHDTVSRFVPYMQGLKRLGSMSSLTNEEMNAAISSKTEYHAAGLLLRLYLFYIIGIQMVGFLVVGAYAEFHPSTRRLLKAQGDLNPWSWAFFHVSSCFYNAGFSLVPESLKHLYDDSTIVVTSVLLVIFGNCLFPIMLRWLVLLMAKSRWFSRKTHRCTAFLIKHPRRASIHLFEDRETWILLLSWIAGNVFQVASFLAFDMQRLPFLPFTQVKQIGIFFFQSFTLRTSGFYILDLYLYSKVVQVVWIFIMIMDSYPLLLTIKYTGSSSEKKKQQEQQRKQAPHSPGSVASGTTAGAGVDPAESYALGPALFLGEIDGTFVGSTSRLASPPPPAAASAGEKPQPPSLSVPQGPAASPAPAPTPRSHHLVTQSAGPAAADDTHNEHLLKQWVLRDVACVYLFLLLILVAETPWSVAGAPTDGLKLDLWVAMFEVISAYSTVGASIDDMANASIASTFCSFSKLVMAMAMLLGRTRSVPSTIDYAFAPPEEQAAPKEQVFILSSALGGGDDEDEEDEAMLFLNDDNDNNDDEEDDDDEEEAEEEAEEEGLRGRAAADAVTTEADPLRARGRSSEVHANGPSA